MAKGGELFLVNAYIPEYLMANRFNHEPGGRGNCWCTAPRRDGLPRPSSAKA